MSHKIIDISEYLSEKANGGLEATIEMEVKINGKIVPDFKENLLEIMRISEDFVKTQIAQEVKKVISLDKIVKYVEKIKDLEWEMHNIVETLLETKIE